MRVSVQINSLISEVHLKLLQILTSLSHEKMSFMFCIQLRPVSVEFVIVTHLS